MLGEETEGLRNRLKSTEDEKIDRSRERGRRTQWRNKDGEQGKEKRGLFRIEAKRRERSKEIRRRNGKGDVIRG